MTDPELFKYDVRVRERMLRKGLIQETEVEKRLGTLADLEGQYVEFELKQPALHRQEAESAPVPRPAPAAPSPASPSFTEAARRFEPEDDTAIPDDEDDDDEDDDDDVLDDAAKAEPTEPAQDGAPKPPTPGEGWESES